MEQGYIQQLEKLAELKDKGILSESEFNLKKSELLKPRVEVSVKPIESAVSEEKPEGTYWLPIPSLVLGIICVLALLDESKWDHDTVRGMFIFSAAGLTLGIVGLSRQAKGRGMSIAGIVLSSIAILAALGMQSN